MVICISLALRRLYFLGRRLMLAPFVSGLSSLCIQNIYGAWVLSSSQFVIDTICTRL